MNVLLIIGRLIKFTLLGAILAPFVTLVPMIVFYMADSHCGKPGDSGGCEMGIAGILIYSIPVGAVLGLLYGIWQVVRQHLRANQTPR